MPGRPGVTKIDREVDEMTLYGRKLGRVILVGLLGAGAGALLGKLLGGPYWWIGGALLGTLVGGIIGGGREWIVSSVQALVLLVIASVWVWLAGLAFEKIGGVFGGILGGAMLGLLFGLFISRGSLWATVFGAIGGAIGGGIDGAWGALKEDASHLAGGVLIGALLGMGLDLLFGWAKSKT